MKQCSIENCIKLVSGRDFCSTHYARFKRRGSPYIVLTNYDKAPKYSSLKEYIESSFKINSKNNCWEWLKSLKKTGHGNAWWNGKHEIAHRLSWMFYEGIIPDGLNVLHKCDNPKCVNPDHLFLGTYLDNNRDRKLKGRNANTNGEKNPFSKLKEFQVIEIINKLRKGVKGAHLAKLYSVSPDTIGKIKSGKNWAYLKVL